MKTPYIKQGCKTPEPQYGWFILPGDAVVRATDSALAESTGTLYWTSSNLCDVDGSTVEQRILSKRYTICYARKISEDPELYKQMTKEAPTIASIEAEIKKLQARIAEIKRKEEEEEEKKRIKVGDYVVALRSSRGGDCAGGFKEGHVYIARNITPDGKTLEVYRDSGGSYNSWNIEHFRKATPNEILLNKVQSAGFHVGGRARGKNGQHVTVSDHHITNIKVVSNIDEARAGSYCVLREWEKTKQPFVYIEFTNGCAIPVRQLNPILIMPVPSVNNYTMDKHEKGRSYVKFGCARISIEMLRMVAKYKDEPAGCTRSIGRIVLSPHNVPITQEDIKNILAHVDDVESQ